MWQRMFSISSVEAYTITATQLLLLNCIRNSEQASKIKTMLSYKDHGRPRGGESKGEHLLRHWIFLTFCQNTNIFKLL